MNAMLTDIATFFNKPTTQFFIPVYQREYSWKREQIDQLLNDIEKVLTKENNNHFLGNVIYKSSTYGGIVSNELIDGQQRVTTMCLIFIGLRNILNSEEMYRNDYINSNELLQKISILNEWITNRFTSENFKMRLKPNNKDSGVFRDIYDNQIKPEDKDSQLYLNYVIILQRLKKWIDFELFSLNDILNVFSKLNLVAIEIKEDDNVKVQNIFESINSTGLSLDNMDLVRNFLLMGLNESEQDLFYKDYWLPYQEKMKKFTPFSKEDEFLRIFLQVSLGRIVSKKMIYSEFKNFSEKKNQYEIINAMEEVLDSWIEIYLNKRDNVYLYDRIWQEDPKNNQMISSILIVAYQGYRNNRISEFDYQEIKKIIAIYMMRRKLTDMDTSPITRLFADTLVANGKRCLENNESLVDYLRKALLEERQETEMRAPRNDEIISSLKNKNFYSLKVCKTALLFLENWNNSILIPSENLEIEHIAPQSADTQVWKEVLGENYDDKKNYLGNLTLVTGKMNKELSNKPWNEKKEHFINNGHLRLNEEIKNLNKFTYEELSSRQDGMINKLFEIF